LPKIRSPYERAKGAFKDAKAPEHSTVRVSPCPTCGAPMTCTRTYKGTSYRFVGVCASDPAHTIERFGYVEAGA
jgi:hypothetical protein